MILVYVCPHCNALRIASRRKDVFCLECQARMNLSDLSFLQWSDMSQEEREEYAVAWNEKEKQ